MMWRRAGATGIGLLVVLLLALPLTRSALAERVYGSAAYCEGCVRWASLGNDTWLAACGMALLALGLLLVSRGRRVVLNLVAFVLVLGMLIDTLLLELLSMRLHMADVLKFGGESAATFDFILALGSGGYWAVPLLILTLVATLPLLLCPIPRASCAGWALAALALLMGAGGAGLAATARGHIHREGVVNILQLQGMRGVNHAYSDAFKRHVLSQPLPAMDICSTGQGRRPDVLLVIVESLSAHHSRLLGGNGYTPELDAIGREHTWFEAFHANGFTTDHGIIALLDGRVPVPAVGRYLSLHAFAGFGDPQRSVVGVLRPEGYEIAFFTTGNLGFLDKSSWLRRMQVDHFEGSESPFYDGMPRGGFDAASDSALYARVLQWLEQRDDSRPFFAALLTVDSHPPFLDRTTGKLDEEGVFRRSDAALGQLYRALQARGFFHNGILLVTGDHRSMTAVAREEWHRYGDSALARIPLVVAGASGLPRGPVGAPFQQVDLLPSLAQLTGQGEACHSAGQGTFLRPEPQPPGYILHARGDQRGRVDIHFPDGQAVLELAGDKSRVWGVRQAEADIIAAGIHRDRIERGQVPEDMVDLLMEQVRWRQGQAQ